MSTAVPLGVDSPIDIANRFAPSLFRVGKRLAVAGAAIVLQPCDHRLGRQSLGSKPSPCQSQSAITALLRKLNIKHFEESLYLLVGQWQLRTGTRPLVCLPAGERVRLSGRSAIHVPQT